MGLPDIVIEFTKKAIATISVGTGGLVGIIVKDAKSNGSHVLKSVDSIPADLSTDNKAYIERAFLGAPKAVHVFVLPAAAEDYTAAYKYFANKRINYICGDPAITPELATNLSTWVKGKRKAGKIHPVAVVPNVVANDKGTVNFCLVGGEKLNVGDTQYTPAQYCSRIAGLLAGLDLNVSATYKPLDEVTAIPEVEDDDTVDAAIDAGQLVLYDSGTGIVIGRGVNSLTTVTQEDTEDLKKIKILAIQDLITTDITDTINKSYVGNYSNSYDNKCLLITAIKGYLTQLENKGSKVQSIKNEKRGRNCGKSIFSGKIYCAKCGAKYWRSKENGYIKFKCSSYSKYGKIPGKGCDNKSFSENALYSILQSLSEQIVEVNTAEVRKSLLNWLESLRERLRASQGDDTIKEEIRKQTARKEKLTDAYMDGIISKEDYSKRYKELEKTLEDLKNKLLTLEVNEDLQSIEEVIQNIDKEMEEYLQTQSFNENRVEFLNQHLTKVTVNKDSFLLEFDLIGGAILTGKDFYLFVDNPRTG